jgi:eukaryotic-like serine/threonine-protein kinase
VADLRERLQEALAGRYRLDREAGRGGMATVYLAHDVKHDRKVALKVLHPELAMTLGPERFQREIRTTARLHHPHILPVLDSGEAAGQLWYTMPFVDGESLRERLRRERQLPLEDALQITRQVADALGYAHSQGVVHRDIKPENILLSRGHALVADFGVARALLAAGGDQLTETGMSVGTPAYMSPEQSLADPVLDGRSDLYSLGCVLYEMLAGEAPYTGTSAQAVVAKRLREPVPHVRTVREMVPEGIDAALTRMLAKAPADRFASAREFAGALQATLRVPTPPTQVPPAAEGRRSRWRPATAIAILLGMVIAVAALFAWRRDRASIEASGSAKTVAVLPFENLGDSADAYFAEGMTDEVRSKLAALPGIEVIARTSSVQYKQTTKNPKQIGRELGVQYLLTGTVRWAKATGGASRVQVRPELVEARSGAGRWGEAFEAPLTDVFGVQAEVAARVAGALGVAMGAGERERLAERPTENLAAYDAFLRGEAATQSLGAGDPASIRRALPLYQAAVALDSAFALAWARLATAHAGLYLYESPVPAEADAARRALARAEALAPNAPETFAARQHYEGWVRLDWTRALDAAKAGLQRYPSRPDLVLAAGLAERSLGRYEAALERFTRAQELDPRSLGVVRRRGETLLYLRRWPEARRVLDQAHSIAPNDLGTIVLMAMTHLGVGDLGEARRVVASAPRALDRVALAVMLALYGDLYWMLDEQAQKSVLSQPVSAFNNYPVAVAMVRTQLYHLRGDSALTSVWADSAKQAIKEQLRAVPNDAQLHAFHGLVSAYLGRKAEAIEEGKRAIALLPITMDAFNGPYLQHQLVRIYILTGEPEKALDHLEALLKIPYYLSPGWLRIDPTLNPLRGNPRFERLAEGE